MFDFGMGEIALTAVIALLVLGPERLPKVARTAGRVMRKARDSWNSVRNEIEREIAAEELKQSLKQTAEVMRTETIPEHQTIAPPRVGPKTDPTTPTRNDGT